MITEYTNRGVCSRKTVIDLAPDGTINDISIVEHQIACKKHLDTKESQEKKGQ